MKNALEGVHVDGFTRRSEKVVVGEGGVCVKLKMIILQGGRPVLTRGGRQENGHST